FKRVIGGAARFGAGQAALEGATEGPQTVIEKAAIQYVDENRRIFTPENFDEIINSVAAGAVMGTALDGATDVAATARPKGALDQKELLRIDDELRWPAATVVPDAAGAPRASVHS